MTLEFAVIVGLGKTLLYLVQSLPYTKTITVRPFDYLFKCDLCLGQWIYFSLFCFYGSTFGPYVPLVSEFLTAAIVTTVVHFASLGFKLKHGVFEDANG